MALVDELVKLRDLHQVGALSAAEYEAAKSVVLGGGRAPLPGVEASTADPAPVAHGPAQPEEPVVTAPGAAAAEPAVEVTEPPSAGDFPMQPQPAIATATPRRRPVFLVVSLLGAAGLAAGAVVVTASQDGPPTVSASSETGREVVNLNDLQVGECVEQELTKDTDLTRLVRVDCDAPHFAELYHVFDVGDMVWPGDEVIGTLTDSGCVSSFNGFIGMSSYESDLEMWSFSPTKETWDVEDRTALCLVQDARGGLTGTLAGARR